MDTAEATRLAIKDFNCDVYDPTCARCQTRDALRAGELIIVKRSDLEEAKYQCDCTTKCGCHIIDRLLQRPTNQTETMR